MGSLFALILGIIGGIASNILVSTFNKKVETKVIAAMVAGDIASFLSIVLRRKHVENLSNVLKRIKSGKPYSFMGNDFVGPDDNYEVFMKANMDKIGLLGPDICIDISTYYTNVTGIRSDFRSASQGRFEDPESQIDLINEDLDLWRETEQLGKSLIIKLTKISTVSVVKLIWWDMKKLFIKTSIA